MKPILVLIGIVCFSLVLPGCSSIVVNTYKANHYEADQIRLFSKPVALEKVQIDRIKNEGTNKIMRVIEDQYPDYRVLGASSFRSTALSDDELKRHAVLIGASHVAVFYGWVGTVQTGVIANTIPLGGGGAIGFSTPIHNDVDEYHAMFLVKHAGGKERIGIIMQALTAEIQQRLERNKGALVAEVLRGPAFDANVLVGDVIIAVNGTQVIDYVSLGILIRGVCRNEEAVVLSVIRGEKGEKRREISIPNCM